MNPDELAIHRGNTKEFIDADPITLRLVPTKYEKTGTGGRKLERLDPRLPQTFRLIPLQDVVTEIQTNDGFTVIPSFVLMGTHDATMERWDTFVLNGDEYQLVSPPRPFHTETSRYFTKCDVARR